MIDADKEFDAASPTPAGEIRHGVRQFSRDAVTLAELQADLLKVELREWMRTSAGPAAALAATAALIALASLPIVLFGLAYVLADAAEWSLQAALFAVGGGGLALAALGGGVAWQRARRSAHAFTRFRSELTQNIRWLKHVLDREAGAAEPNPFEPGRVRPR